MFCWYSPNPDRNARTKASKRTELFMTAKRTSYSPSYDAFARQSLSIHSQNVLLGGTALIQFYYYRSLVRHKISVFSSIMFASSQKRKSRDAWDAITSQSSLDALDGVQEEKSKSSSIVGDPENPQVSDQLRAEEAEPSAETSQLNDMNRKLHDAQKELSGLKTSNNALKSNLQNKQEELTALQAAFDVMLGNVRDELLAVSKASNDANSKLATAKEEAASLQASIAAFKTKLQDEKKINTQAKQIMQKLLGIAEQHLEYLATQVPEGQHIWVYEGRDVKPTDIVRANDGSLLFSQISAGIYALQEKQSMVKKVNGLQSKLVDAQGQLVDYKEQSLKQLQWIQRVYTTLTGLLSPEVIPSIYKQDIQEKALNTCELTEDGSMKRIPDQVISPISRNDHQQDISDVRQDIAQQPVQQPEVLMPSLLGVNEVSKPSSSSSKHPPTTATAISPTVKLEDRLVKLKLDDDFDLDAPDSLPDSSFQDKTLESTLNFEKNDPRHVLKSRSTPGPLIQLKVDYSSITNALGCLEFEGVKASNPQSALWTTPKMTTIQGEDGQPVEKYDTPSGTRSRTLLKFQSPDFIATNLIKFGYENVLELGPAWACKFPHGNNNANYFMPWSRAKCRQCSRSRKQGTTYLQDFAITEYGTAHKNSFFCSLPPRSQGKTKESNQYLFDNNKGKCSTNSFSSVD
ncbi:hypothetical protein GQ44DRAFT_794376 [Phaeosphaeriaceae sp. PMI808]|nr:hypothetical protein GQ44DRAFT_794376 [Phaeosphaeriaceae sp. PMI808]